MKLENNGKALPILSFPCTSLLGVKTDELVHSAELQAKGMKAVADRTDAAASVSMMDLSVEAEAFGAEVRFSPDEVPSVIGAVVGSPEDADKLAVPAVGAGRTGTFVKAIRQAKGLITDRPVLAGMIGPFSLAGRLLDVTKTMLYLVDEPDMVHAVLRKGTDFLIAYAKAFKQAGADGIVMAEPLAGLISPRMATKFSAPYVKEVVDAVQTADFPVIYHNCGNNTIKQAGSIFGIGAAGYHFGNAISMKEMLAIAPKDVWIMGNVDPAGELANGTPESVRAATLKLMEECCSGNPNFIVSSGCDIPPHAPWANLDAFFAAVRTAVAVVLSGVFTITASAAGQMTMADNGLVRRTFDVSSGSFGRCTYQLLAGRDFFDGKTSREFSFCANGRTYSGHDSWKDFHVEKSALANGGEERRLSFVESAGAFRVTLAYATYPNLPLVRKTLEVENLGDADLRIEAVCVEDFQTTLDATHSQTFRRYGRYRASGPYVGDWDDPLVVVHDLVSRRGLAIGNEEVGVLKRTGVFEGGHGVRAGVTHPGQPYAFRRWLKKGQSWESAAVFTAPYESEPGPQRVMDTTVADYVRKHMGARVTSLGKKPMFVYNTWEPFRHDIDEKLVCELADAAAACGVEEFVIDDGWQVNVGDGNGLYGDWMVDRKKFPNGLKPVFDHIKAKGMKPGLWMSLARANRTSRVCTEHPDWFVKDADGRTTDLHWPGQKHCVTACMGTGWKDYMRDKILGYVRDYGLAYVKLDFAIVTSAYIYDDEWSGCRAKDHPFHRDREESLGVLYARCMRLFDELHAAAPDLFIDCTFETAGKLQLMDYGIARHAEGNWLSNIGEHGEESDGPMRARGYAWGRCPALPATSLVIGNLFMNSSMRLLSYKSLTGSLPIMLGDPRRLTEAERADFKAWSGWLKGLEARHGIMSFRQDLAGFGEPTAGGWDGFARINTDTKSGGLVGVFRTDSAEPSRLVTVRDLDPVARYAVLRAPDGTSVADMTGAELSERGFAVALALKTDGALFEIRRQAK